MLIVTPDVVFWTLEFQQGLEYNLQGHVHYNPVSKKSTSGTINIWAPQMGLIKTGPGLINPPMMIPTPL